MNTHGKSGRRARAKKRGFTLIELTISMSILMVGIISVVSATTRMHGLRKHNRERVVAGNGLRSIAERIHARSYRLGLEDSQNWVVDLLAAYGPGGNPGNTFDVVGINVDRGQNVVGTIEFVTDEEATDTALGVQVGMPRDLNGDGDADDTDVTADARILPVILRLQWHGQTGSQTIEHGFYVTQY